VRNRFSRRLKDYPLTLPFDLGASDSASFLEHFERVLGNCLENLSPLRRASFSTASIRQSFGQRRLLFEQLDFAS